MNSMGNAVTFSGAASGRSWPRNAKAVLGMLEKISHGTLEVRLPDGDPSLLWSGRGFGDA